MEIRREELDGLGDDAQFTLLGTGRNTDNTDNISALEDIMGCNKGFWVFRVSV